MGQEINSEDDILHIRNLPDFGVLSQRDSELLLSYLTVPYLRIPLVLTFFASELRIKALDSRKLKHVLDCVLFEPCGWFSLAQEAARLETPEVVPAPHRNHLTTPNGMLVNELQRSPLIIIQALNTLLDLALDLDTGKFSRMARLILYVVRLLVRVEEYMLYMLRHSVWLKNQKAVEAKGEEADVSRSGYEAFVRGLAATDDATLLLLTKLCADIRRVMTSEVFPMVERWCLEATKADDMDSACLLHAHLCFIHKNIDDEDLTEDIVSILLSSQIFLNTRHRYSVDIEHEKKKEKILEAKDEDDDAEPSSRQLEISEQELFDLFQRHRVKIERWLDANPEARNRVMESVVRVVTFSGTRTKAVDNFEARKWTPMEGKDCGGRLVPDTFTQESKVEEDTILTLMGKEAKDKLLALEADDGKTVRNAPVKRPNGWIEPLHGEKFEDFMRRRMKVRQVDTEVNLQLGEFTLKTSRLTVLDEKFSSLPDFKVVFGKELNLQAADVVVTQNRHWVRLVGKRHDLQLWVPDTRLPFVHCKRKYPDNLETTEGWIRNLLEPVRSRHLGSAMMFLRKDPYPENTLVARLQALIPEKKQVFDVFVLQSSKAVHIYRLQEHGRRHFRQLVYSSNAGESLHDMPLVLVDNSKGPFGGKPPAWEAGRATGSDSKQSLVIMRALTNATGLETYIPKHLLDGLIPAALLEDYVFWQNSDNSLTGYQTPEAIARVRTSTKLRITLVSQEGKMNVLAHIVREPAVANVVYDINDLGTQTLTLLNLLYSSQGSTLRRLADTLLRLEHLSHVLVWTRANVTTAGDTCSIDVVELPRMRLHFIAKEVVDRKFTSEGKTEQMELRLLSGQLDGMYVSYIDSPDVQRLVGDLPHSLLLQNDNSELFVLIPATCRPMRPQLSSEQFSTQLLLDRRDPTWLANLPNDTRHYVYPVHLSRAFLFTPTLASALYLLVLRWVNRQYEAVFRLASSCVTDTELTQEEKQLWAQLQTLMADADPNSHACRLKLSLVTADTEMVCPWSVATEIAGYVTKLSHISTACRLTFAEELQVFSQVTGLSEQLTNRKRQLKALEEGKRQVSLVSPRRLEWPDFDPPGQDRSWFARSETIADIFSRNSYTKPFERRGMEALRVLNIWIMNGLQLSGGKDNLGFLFLYELMTGALNFAILPTDAPHTLACVLMRLLPPSDSGTGLLMSMLRTLALNPQICNNPGIPKMEEKKKSALNINITMFKAGKNPFAVLCADLQNFLLSNQSGMKWADYKENPRGPVVPMAADLKALGEQVRGGDWLTLRVADFSCSSRVLRPTEGMSPYLDAKAMEAHGGLMMTPLGLDTIVVQRSRTDRKMPSVSPELPFEVGAHTFAQSQVAQSMINRLRDDCLTYSRQQNEGKQPQLRGLFPEDLTLAVASKGASPQAKFAFERMLNVLTALFSLRESDMETMRTATQQLLDLVNNTTMGLQENAAVRSRLAFVMAKLSGRETPLDIEFVVGNLLSSRSDADLLNLSPFLGSEIGRLHDLTISLTLASVRVGHINRCLDAARELYSELEKMARLDFSRPDAEAVLFNSLSLKSTTLAGLLATKRAYLDASSGAFDPRFLICEFAYNLVLRKSQIELMHKFMRTLNEGKSMCNQMIMGSGKTTVVGPLLALFLGDGKTLVTQVVPAALLDFSRGIMRERFTAIIQKPVYTFRFDRFSQCPPALFRKLCMARDRRAVLVTHPTAIKSFMLKFLEIMHTLDEPQEKRSIASVASSKLLQLARSFGLNVGGNDNSEAAARERSMLRLEAAECVRALQLLRSGALILDEVDLILHPLKSELNWPLGKKYALDFTQSDIGMGMRWEVPWHLLDGLLFPATGRMTVPFASSRTAQSLLERLQAAITKGYQLKHLQSIPHLVLLNRRYYDKELLPLLADWLMVFLGSKGVKGIPDHHLRAYLLHAAQGPSDAVASVRRELGGEYLKLLNLSHDWLVCYLPFVLGKIDRVSFGLLSGEDLRRALASDPLMAKSRQLLAVPFVGKDVPSESSEFSHPDIVLGLTILGYRYEGLRRKDLIQVLRMLMEMCVEQSGTFQTRPSCQLYSKWINLAG